MVNGDDGSDGGDVNDSECDGDVIVKRLVAKQKMFQCGKHLGTYTLGCICFWQIGGPSPPPPPPLLPPGCPIGFTELH